jgi:hypothetical protein
LISSSSPPSPSYAAATESAWEGEWEGMRWGFLALGFGGEREGSATGVGVPDERGEEQGNSYTPGGCGLGLLRV